MTPTSRGRRRRHTAHGGKHPQILHQCKQHRREGAGPEMTTRPYTSTLLPPRRRHRPHSSTPYLQPYIPDPGFPRPSPAVTDEEGEGNHRRRRGNGGNTAVALSLAFLYCRRGRGGERKVIINGGSLLADVQDDRKAATSSIFVGYGTPASVCRCSSTSW